MPKDESLHKNNGSSSDEKGKKKKKTSKLSLFIKTFLIAAGVLAVLSIAGLVMYNIFVKPPSIPNDGYSDSAFIPIEGHEDDIFVGGGLKAPSGFTSSDRKKDFYTFLIVGTDAGASTDTIMVAAYDGVNKTANLIGIPRDSLVNVKRTVKKINAAYGAGTLNGGGRQGGIDQLKREIKTIIGFTPDFYVLIDLNAFVKIVDSVGGIDVYAPFNMKWDDPIQNLHIDIPKGDNHLDGKEALKFARYRNGNNGRYTISDYDRIKNQQTVIKAVLGKLLTPSSLLKIPEFIDIFNENVYSDITAGNMAWFAKELNEIKGTDALSAHTMPTTGTSGLPMYYEYLDEAGIIELVNNTINPYTKNIEAKDIDIIGRE